MQQMTRTSNKNGKYASFFGSVLPPGLAEGFENDGDITRFPPRALRVLKELTALLFLKQARNLDVTFGIISDCPFSIKAGHS